MASIWTGHLLKWPSNFNSGFRQNRFFVLTRSSLSYYENELMYQLGVVKGTMPITTETLLSPLNQRLASAIMKEKAKGIVGVNHSDVDTDILVFKSNGGEMWIKGEQESVEEMFIQKVQEAIDYQKAKLAGTLPTGRRIPSLIQA